MRSFWIVQIFAKWGHGNDVSAVFSAVACLVPRCPKNNHSTLASAQGFAPQIRIHGRDVTEKRTHGHDTSFAFWNLNKNPMKPQDLFDAYSHAVYWRIVLIQGYTGAEKNFARDNDKCKHMHLQSRGGREDPLGLIWFDFQDSYLWCHIKQQEKRRWDRVGDKGAGIVCRVSEFCWILLPNEVMATMSRQYSPQSPAWSQEVCPCQCTGLCITYSICLGSWQWHRCVTGSQDGTPQIDQWGDNKKAWDGQQGQ